MSTATATQSGVVAAMNAWSDLLGAAHATRDAEACRRAGTATYATDQRVIGVIRPGSRDEVRRCLAVANDHRVPVYPVSRGRNWGLGSAVPAVTDCVVMDLSRLDRIVELDEERGFITVQPGVTFQQVFELLERRNSGLRINTTLGPPDGSLIGNALERGHGIGRHADRFAHSCAMEIVLPNGEIIRTGTASAPHSKTGPLHRWGVGPHLDGLFTQSNLGVVTEMTFWLPRKASHHTMFRFEIEGPRNIEAVMKVAADLAAESAVYLAFDNAYRSGYDRRAFGGGGGRQGAYQLIGRGGLHCHGAAEEWGIRRRLMKGLAGYVTNFQYMSPLRRKIARVIRKPLALAGLPLGEDLLYPRNGGSPPSFVRVAAMYAIKDSISAEDVRARQRAGDIDLDRDRCGVMWCCPSVPLRGDDVCEVLTIAEKTCKEAGFPPQVSFTPHNPRCLDSFGAIVYDRDEPGKDEEARASFDDFQEALYTAGYVPYRLPIQDMHFLGRDAPSYARLLESLKKAVDPNDILAPGRYDGRLHWPSRTSSGG